MTVVLDSDHMSLLERENEQSLRLRARLASLAENEVATTIISYEEQSRGWLAYVARARTLAQRINAYRKLFLHLEIYRKTRVLEFDERAGAELERLRKARLRIGELDLRISAITLAHSATLLTRNLRDFRQVPGLRVEDWTV